MWISFSERFDWKPTRGSVIVYRPGMRLSVTRACGTQAIAAGKARPEKTPTRNERDSYMRGVGGIPPLKDGE